MALAAPKPSEMFSDAQSGAEVMERFEQYKGALADVHKEYGSGKYRLTDEGLKRDTSGASSALETLQKSLSAEQLDSLRSEMAELGAITADVGKDWSIPAASGNVNLVPYDLEAPAKLLVPRNTPLRNSLPRERGQGLAVEYRRVLGWSNMSVGGVADKPPFTDSQSVQTNFGSLALRRGQKIEYASDTVTVSYVEMSLSDQVNWKAQYASQGFQDIRSLSQTALLWAHMTGEEKAILYGRGSASQGYAGAISAPTVTAVGASTGGSIAAGTYYVKVTARGGSGASAASSEVNTGALSGSTNKITITVTNEPVGALGYDLYIGTSSNAETYVTSFTGNSVVLTTTPATGGAAVPSGDTSVQTGGYDGFLTVLTNPALSGYVKHVNGSVFDPTTPANSLGDGPFQDAFASLYGVGDATGSSHKRQADPDEIWCDGNVRRKLGDYVKINANATGYRIQLTEQGATGGVTIGAVASGIQNQVTGKMVNLNVHPFMPVGAAIIRSTTLPVPDSNISATSAIRSVQEYMSVDWPVVQFTYDASTYWMGTMVHYAPQWSGALLGLS